MELSPDGKPAALIRASFDDWRIDACPHHGPALAFSGDGRRHQVWFNGDADKGGVFYAAADSSGKLLEPMRLGSARAAHGDVATQGDDVVLVWKQFDGISTAILGKISHDKGASWRDVELARTAATSDQPHLIHAASQIHVVWRTANEGVRIIPIHRHSKERKP
jgi:hypothetical protein